MSSVYVEPLHSDQQHCLPYSKEGILVGGGKVKTKPRSKTPTPANEAGFFNIKIGVCFRREQDGNNSFFITVFSQIFTGIRANSANSPCFGLDRSRYQSISRQAYYSSFTDKYRG